MPVSAEPRSVPGVYRSYRHSRPPSFSSPGASEARIWTDGAIVLAAVTRLEAANVAQVSDSAGTPPTSGLPPALVPVPLGDEQPATVATTANPTIHASRLFAMLFKAVLLSGSCVAARMHLKCATTSDTAIL